jgi:hypothetical protein
MNKKINIYLPSDIETQKGIIRHMNAFILPNGNFVLAKGYTGCNPSHQLESSALHISRYLTDTDLKKEYEEYIQQTTEKKKLHYLRTMLVHYYGFALFARVEHITAFNDRNTFFDYSLIPNPKYYGKEVTPEQISTLEKLFKLNDDGTLRPSNVGTHHVTSEDILTKVLQHKRSNDNWHSEF